MFIKILIDSIILHAERSDNVSKNHNLAVATSWDVVLITLYFLYFIFGIVTSRVNGVFSIFREKLYLGTLSRLGIQFSVFIYFFF